MLAWQAVRYGAPSDALALNPIALPIPGVGEVRIHVHAASVNPIDFKLLNGDLRQLMPLQFPRTIGFDAAGVIDAVGEGSRFAPGDAVFVRASRDSLGAFAQYTVQPQQFVALAPTHVDAVGAASLPLVALTTVQALVDRAQAKHGQRILIHAGSGGLGSFAIQYAHHLGLRVDTTTSSANVDWVAALGADRVFAYDREDYRTAGQVYDIVFDTLGGSHTLVAFDLVKRGGCVVSVAGPPDAQMRARFGRNILARGLMRWMARKVMARSRASGVGYFRFLTESSGEQLAGIAALVDAAVIHPVLDKSYAFKDLPAAMRALAGGHSRGKVTIRMQDVGQDSGQDSMPGSVPGSGPGSGQA